MDSGDNLSDLKNGNVRFLGGRQDGKKSRCVVRDNFADVFGSG
jgi:hypothetical protein